MPLHHRLTEEIRVGPEGPKVAALFDLDQTLLAGISVTSFFRERLLSGRMAPREFADSVLGAMSFGMGRTGFSGMMVAAAAAYRGMAESVMEELGEEVFEKHLATQIYPESRALVEAHREMGHTVAIVSAATRYQAVPMARELSIEHVLCTRLQVKDGVLTGGVVRPTCWGEGKAVAARELAAAHDLDLGQSYFYTDSHEDLPLLEAVGRPRPLNPNRQLAQIAKERVWPVRQFSSRGTPSLGDVVRTGLVFGSMVPSAVAGLAAGFSSGSRREAVNVAGSIWGDLATSLAGIDFRVEGEENLWSHRPAVFIFNHQSALDTILIWRLLRRELTTVATEKLGRNPVLGPLLDAAGVVFADHANSTDPSEALWRAVEALRDGRSLAMAPEATRAPTRRLGSFKKTPFQLAMDAGVPVVPVVFRNVLDALPRDALVVRPATVEAVVLEPVPTTAWTPESLDAEIEAIRARYLDILES